MKEFNLREKLKTLQEYKQQIVEYLELEKDKVAVYVTVRKRVQEIDHKKFGDIFRKWMKLLNI